MDEETQKKVEATVLEILRGSDLESVVRNAAADRLGIDLSLKDRKLFVHRVVEDYLHSLSQEDEQQQQQQQGGAGGEDKGKQEEEEEEEEEEKEGGGGKRKYEDEGDLILCRG